MNWGKSIITAFIFFALFIGVLVTVCLRQEVSLVSKNYYQEELDYQQRINAMNNYNALTNKPSLSLADHTLNIHFNQLLPIQSGTLIFFRPSNGAFDKRFSLTTDTDSQQINLNSLPSGRYQVKLEWTMDSKKYFTEEFITL